MSKWTRSVPVKDGWYWFRPDGGDNSAVKLVGGRMLVSSGHQTFDVSALIMIGAWHADPIKEPK